MKSKLVSKHADSVFMVSHCDLLSEQYKLNCKMWREGYDYPADDEDDGRDYYEEADEQHDKHQDEKL